MDWPSVENEHAKMSVVTKSLTNMQKIGLETEIVIVLFISATSHYVGTNLNPCFK